MRAEQSALHIVRGDRAPTVIGVRNISRIVAPLQTRFSPTALALCMQSGICVVFRDANGAVQGLLHGRAKTTSLLPDRIAELLAQPNGPRIYSTWWKAMESRARCRLAKRLRIPEDRHRSRVLRKAMLRAAQLRADRATQALLEKKWHLALSGLTAAILREAGFDARGFCKLWPKVDLHKDLQTLLEWELFLPRIIALTRIERARQASVPVALLRAKVISAFECERSRLENRGWHILHRLDMRMMELGVV